MPGPKYLPLRADVVGSLLRPDTIHKARARHAAGEITRDDLWKIETGCIAEAVDLQKELRTESSGLTASFIAVTGSWILSKDRWRRVRRRVADEVQTSRARSNLRRRAL